MNTILSLLKPVKKSLALGIMISVFSLGGLLEANKTSMDKLSDIFEVMKNRRSVRQFKSTAIPRADIEKIIAAAVMAPTSGNQQPWKFVIVDEPSILDEIRKESVEIKLIQYKQYYQDKDKSKITPENIKKVRIKIEKYVNRFLSAPVYIGIYTDSKSKYPSYNQHDGPLAAGYLMLAARAMGYGTVYATDSIPTQVTKKVLNIPDHYVRVCFTPLGIPKEWPKGPAKKAPKEFIIYGKVK